MALDINAYSQKDFQRGLVANILRTPDLLQRLQEGKITQKDVSNPIHRICIQAALSILHIRGSVEPDICIPVTTLGLQIKSMIKNGLIHKEEREPLIHEVDAMYSMELDPTFYLSCLSDYLSEIRIANLLKSSKKNEKSNVELAREMTELLKETEVPLENGKTYSPLMELQMSDEPMEVVPCMIHAIDSNMNGGLGLGHFGIICGITGLGKTTLAVNFCWGAAKLGYPAALATLELTAKEISERLYSKVTGIPYERIMKGDNGCMRVVRSEVQELMMREDEATRKRFDIWDYSEQICTLAMLDAKLAELQRRGKLPKMLFVDWIDAMGVDPSQRKNGIVMKELRHLLQSYCEGLSNLAKKYRIAIWATTQSNKAGDQQREVRMGNASEGFSKAFRCTCFLGMGATDQDRNDHRITVTAGKMRYGRIFSTQIEARLEVQSFHDIPVSTDEDAAMFTPLAR